MPVSKCDLKIDWATHAAAKYACENWHYSGCIPKSKLAKMGVWEFGKYIGCVIFGVGATSNLVRPYGLKMDEGCELVRIALSEHQSPVSRIIAISIKLLKNKYPRLRLVVSFADMNQGHLGSIYQASGWIYSGMAADHGGSVIIGGKLIHGRSCGLKYGTRSIDWLRKNVDASARPAETKGKHRYLMPLDKAMRKQILPLSKPYPKRASSETVDTSGDQPEKGGSIPTDALQFFGGES